MGTGNRANATIGRAIRLVLLNAGATREFDQSTLGTPGKFTFCVAEAENDDWLPLHVERGFKREESTVTVFATEGPNQVTNHVAQTPEALLLTVADRMSTVATQAMQWLGAYVVVICPEHLQLLLEHGWDKKRVRQFLFEYARRTKSDLHRFGVVLEEPSPDKASEWVRPVPSSDHIMVIAGGGKAGRFSAVIPGWGSIKFSKPVTKSISSGFT